MPPTKRWLLGKYVPMMQDCWAYCFSSKAQDRHVHRLLVSRLVTNITAKSRLRVDIIDWLDFTFARSTRSIDSTWVDSVDRLDSAENRSLDRSTRSISRSTAYPACPGNMRIKRVVDVCSADGRSGWRSWTEHFLCDMWHGGVTTRGIETHGQMLQ